MKNPERLEVLRNNCILACCLHHIYDQDEVNKPKQVGLVYWSLYRTRLLTLCAPEESVNLCQKHFGFVAVQQMSAKNKENSL